MITQKDLEEAIAECQGVRNPNASTCIKLAAFYTIRNELFPERKDVIDQLPVYSFQTAEKPQILSYEGDSEFAQLIDGMETDRVIGIFDELMGSLEIVEPRLHAAVLRKLRE